MAEKQKEKDQDSEGQSFDDLFTDDETMPQSNWFNFEEVGDTIQGTLRDVFEAEGRFGTQTVYVVETDDSVEWNVALKQSTHKVPIQHMKQAEIGDRVGFRLNDLVDTGKGHPAKQIQVRIRKNAKAVNDDF